jgi:hypothetical protein
VIPTPALDRIAAQGLRYTDFHSTALCSPTRAALITGRNHHSVGNGVVGEIATGFPGYDSIIPIDKGTIGTILQANGYATSWFGKDHNTPSYQSSQAGPFNQWPNGMGFDYFYGFVGGDTSQWQPNLYRNTTAIYPFLGNPRTALAGSGDARLLELGRRFEAALVPWLAMCAKSKADSDAWGELVYRATGIRKAPARYIPNPDDELGPFGRTRRRSITYKARRAFV